MASSSTDRLADFVSHTGFEDLPDEAVERSTLSILDCLGVSLAGCSQPASLIAQAYVSGAGGNPEAHIWGTNAMSSAANAAFANGIAGHALDFDDVFWPTMVNPTVAVLPAALAIAEQIGGSGRDVLTAFALGVEAMCKIGRAVMPAHHQRGHHSTATIGSFGAAVATAKLLGLSHREIVNAVGIVASEAAGLRQQFGSMTGAFHAGRANENGILAGRLAALGFTAAGNVLEAPWGFFSVMGGEGAQAFSPETLGNPYDLATTGAAVKLYPVCGCALAAIDAAIALHRRYQLRPAEIAGVEVGTHQSSVEVLIHHNPQTGLQGKFSMEYCVARALADGRVLLQDFSEERVRESRVVDLVKRTKVFVHPEFTSFEPDRAEVGVKLKGGGTLAQRIDVAKGHPLNPLSREELMGKYTSCAKVALPETRVAEIAEMVINMASLPDVRVLTRALCP